MCGIVGFWSSLPEGQSRALAREMAAQIAHRGPDSAGEWFDAGTGLTLAHRRLSILDLSEAGHQPMSSADGRFVISYNGEIYNHRALRTELEAAFGTRQWRGHSDSETLVEALAAWGVADTLARLNGMFAFAAWDRQDRRLYLARDRMGEKPLYYGRLGRSFAFASELKPLRRHPEWQGRVDRQALTLYLRHNYVPAPHSIYEGIRKLPPAHYLTVAEDGRLLSDPVAYWRLEDAVEKGQASPLTGDAAELTDRLEALLSDAVGLRMEADVPLGAFLSGGFDSSTVVALMQAQSARPVRSFSIGFNEAEFNEAEHAKAVAQHLGTEHTELYLTPQDAMDVVPKLPGIWDEPFSDSSQIPTYLVSRMAREHVTVSLSGDGGDELFCGYGRYARGHAIWKRIGALPGPLRDGAARMIRALPSRMLDRAGARLPGRLRQPALGDRAHKLAEIMACPSGEAFYRGLVSHAKDPEALVLGGHEPITLLNDPDAWPEVSDLRERMMYLDARTYLPDDILVKVDRASMAVSLEGRIPLLDHRVVEFAAALPLEFKVRENRQKWLLREVLGRHVPRALTDRPKMGFGVPIEHWLRDGLRDWAGDLLDPVSLSNAGFFEVAPIRRMWEEHLSGRRRWHYYLWDILMFQAWLETEKP